MKKKLLCLLLAAALLVAMTACGGNEAEPVVDTAASGEASAAAETTESTGLVGVRAAEDYDAVSAELYNTVLGEFYALYEDAAACTDTDERYAKMAVAEAKLLESGIFIPNESQGGAAVIGRIVPNTVSTVKWGGDSDRFSKILVTEEMITAEDYADMRALYGELQGTGTYYEKVQELIAEKGYTLKNTYNYRYTGDPQSWDAFAEWNATLYEPLCNTFDQLMQYDCENQLQPALAESYEVSADGLTYTFHIRQGVMWVDSQGRDIAELTAQDFVSGAKHLFDMGSGMEDLLTVDGAGIVGATDYYYGDITDFSQVGIEAVDDYTLVYTLEAPCPYFLTMLGYSEFAPLCTSYYESQGGGFGADYNEECTYGTDPDHIAYCGPYLITGATSENSIYFRANESYWDAENVTIKELNWLYDDGSDPTKTYNDCLNGVIDATGLDTSMIEMAKEDGNYDKYVHISGTDATAYLVYLNLNRGAFANMNDGTALASQKTQDEVNATYAAVNNLHFRLAMSYAMDRVSYNAQARGDELASTNLINSYTTGDMVQLSTDVTVDINGTATTFPAGTYYGEILQAQLTADGSPVVAWNPDANDGLGGSTGYDGWYNPEAAAAELELAIAELADAGVEVSAENPIVMDYPVWSGGEIYINRANCYKQSVEAALNGCVQVNIVTTTDVNEWYYAEYYVYSGAEMNFDIGDMTGWSPDFGDPSSMLATFLPDYAGYCTMSLGIY